VSKFGKVVLSWETPDRTESKVNDLNIILEILDNRAEFDYYEEQAEIAELLNGEELPSVEFEPYDNEGTTITERKAGN